MTTNISGLTPEEGRAVARVAQLRIVFAEVERMSNTDDLSVDDGWVPWGLLGAPGELQHMVDNGVLDYRETELGDSGVMKKWVRPRGARQ